jgi:hypothetical protein
MHLFAINMNQKCLIVTEHFNGRPLIDWLWGQMPECFVNFLAIAIGGQM